jgi:hypothetical protein
VAISILVYLDFARSLMSYTFILKIRKGDVFLLSFTLKLPKMIAAAAAFVNVLTFFIMLRLKNLVNYLSEL